MATAPAAAAAPPRPSPFGPTSTKPGKVQNWILKGALLMAVFVIAVFVIGAVIKDNVPPNDGTQAKPAKQAQPMLIPINCGNTPPLLVPNPQDIIRKDSMFVDTNFRDVIVPEWIKTAGIPGRAYEHYAQTMEFAFTDGSVIRVGPGYPDITGVTWSQFDEAKVRLIPLSGRLCGILYFVQRETST